MKCNCTFYRRIMQERIDWLQNDLVDVEKRLKDANWQSYHERSTARTLGELLSDAKAEIGKLTLENSAFKEKVSQLEAQINNNKRWWQQ